MPTTPAPRSRKRIALTLLAIALVGGVIAYLPYRSYAAEHLHPRPKVIGCTVKSRKAVSTPRIATGTEPWEGIDGQQLFLSTGEYKAASCASLIDKEFGRRVASALALEDQEARAQAMVALVRNPKSDPEAGAAYLLASFALSGLPKESPEVQAAKAEVDLIHGCRFDTRLPCPTRPPPPAVVYAAGIPAAAAAVGLTGLGLVAAVTGIAARIRRRKADRAAKAQEPQADALAEARMTSEGGPEPTDRSDDADDAEAPPRA
ncbi:hypothetical protein [Chondromyces apiculatus]|uniref:Uncharacterized protein n=1 Tax=Chondromyces apiculatus DSM 436 TaxID=1192034 RepID=A0A017SU08_9BACT|nr:hypothetical protein [Chondromyces apiculatus]EYF00449.1 Hypothetical protein CAP_0818 [Chondromyces apiculatus DSM 436]